MRILSAKSAVTTLLIALWLTVIALNWPGHFSTDSVIQLLEGRTGHYETWHPPVMSWLLGIADFILPGGGLFAAFDATLLFGSLLLLVRLRERVSWWAVPVLVACALTPQFLLYPGIVWKDVLFATAAIAGFACLAFAAARWKRRAVCLFLIGLSLLFLTLAALARQNGIVVSLMGAVAFGLIARRESETPWIHGAAFLVALLSFVVASTFALQMRADRGKGRVDEIKMLQLYDFSGAVASDHGLPLDILHRGDPAFERLIRKDGARLFTPQRVDPLQKFSPVETARDAASPALMTAQWRDLIVHHPLLYLKVRAAIFRWTLLTPDIDRCVPFVVGFSGPAPILHSLNAAERYDDRDEALENYAQPLTHTPIFSHGIFALLAAAMAALLYRRRASADLALIALLAGAGLFVGTFFVISLACDYRYLYLLDMAAMTALFYAALGSPTLRPRLASDAPENDGHAPAA